MYVLRATSLFSTLVLGATAAAPAGLEPESRLERAVYELAAAPGVECVLVSRAGRLLAERSVRGDSCNEPHNIQSASKSILSLLAGISLELGVLESVDQTLDELLPRATATLSPEKRAITLANLLAMESGLASTSGEHYGAWVTSPDWVQAALRQPLIHESGTTFTYSTGNTHLVAAALARAVDGDLLSWANRVLFTPLGITVDGWDRGPAGIRFGGNNFAITARELLRIGELVLDEGQLDGNQLVPQRWLERSFQVHSEGWPERYGAYGFLWWLRPEADPPAVMAVGYGGQFLYLAPQLELAVVLTSTNRGKGAGWDRGILQHMEEELVPAIRGAAPGD